MTTQPPAISITKWPHHASPRGERAHGSWRRLATTLRLRSAQPPAEDGWSPATFASDYRSLPNVHAVHALVLDHDKGDVTPERACELWAAHLAIVHTTRRHTAAHPRLRVVLALSRPLAPAEQPILWQWAVDRCRDAMQTCDTATRDASRLWYWPSIGSDGHPGTVAETAGAAIDVDALLAEQRERTSATRAPVRSISREPRSLAPPSVVSRARDYLATLDPAISGQGGSQQTLKAAIAVVRGFILPLDVSLDLLTEYNERCLPPWSTRQLQHKIRSAERCERVGWGWLLDADWAERRRCG